MFCDFIFITASQIVQGKVTSDEKFLFSLDSQVNIEILYTCNKIIVNDEWELKVLRNIAM